MGSLRDDLDGMMMCPYCALVLMAKRDTKSPTTRRSVNNIEISIGYRARGNTNFFYLGILREFSV